MMRKSQGRARELVSEAVVDRARGLNAELAQQLSRRARAFDCESTIETPQGRAADARDLYQLLMLGIATGERVVVRCRGPQASAAREALVEVLEPGRTGAP